MFKQRTRCLARPKHVLVSFGKGPLSFLIQMAEFGWHVQLRIRNLASWPTASSVFWPKQLFSSRKGCLGRNGWVQDQIAQGVRNMPMFYGLIPTTLFNHRSSQKPAGSPELLVVFWKEGSLERMEMEGTPMSQHGCL